MSGTKKDEMPHLFRCIISMVHHQNDHFGFACKTTNKPCRRRRKRLKWNRGRESKRFHLNRPLRRRHRGQPAILAGFLFTFRFHKGWKGGIQPLQSQQRIDLMQHLTTDERITLQFLHQQGKKQKEIAKELGRSPSTISRELRRNTMPSGVYSASFACRYAQDRKDNATRRNAITPEVLKVIDAGLDERLSPEQIVGRQKQQHGIAMPCVQTIYNHIERDRRSHGERYKRLRYHGKPRRKYGTGKASTSKIPARRDISERPKTVEDRKRFGDFECDLIIGAQQSGAILTINDRMSGLVLMEKLPNKKAATVCDALIRNLQPFQGMVTTLTSDNGTEFVEHQAVTAAIGCDYFFARPYHSWERGSNENLNGLIRDYFPKSMPFTELTNEDIKQVQAALNRRPRKRHSFLNPIEIVTKVLKRFDLDCIRN